MGRGRTFLGNTNRIVDGILGGWELSSMAIIESGVRLGVPSGWDYVRGRQSNKPRYVQVAVKLAW